MQNRTSKNSSRHSDVNYPHYEYAKMSKYDKLKMYDELASNVTNRQVKTVAEQYAAMRATLKLVHFYPVIKSLKSDFLADNPSRWDFISSLTQNARSTVYCNRRELLHDDLSHIEKIMIRYQFDFDKAFDFFVLNNLLRTDFNYRGNTGKKIYQVADSILYSKLVETAAKAAISEQQLQAIIPALCAKMASSESKVLLAKHKESMFSNNTGQFFKTAGACAKELEACVKKYENRSMNFTK